MSAGLLPDTVSLIDPTRRAEEVRHVLASADPDHVAEIRAATQTFEGYFIGYLIKVMRETIPIGLIHNKAGQQFYSFYDQEIGRLAAQAGGMGLGRMMEEQIQSLSSDAAISASQVSEQRGR